MRYVFPCDIVLDEEELQATGRVAFNVTFPDVYGANTCGWSWEEAIEMAGDCLGVALGMYVDANEDIPHPSPVAEGQALIPAPPVVAAKLALYTAIRQQGVSLEGLADILRLDMGAVRKLLDPGYRSHITQLENALRAVGRVLVVEDAVRIPVETQSIAPIADAGN